MATLKLEQQREAISLYRNGLSAQQIAHHFGVKIDAIYYTLRYFKIHRRTTQESNRIRFETKPLSYHIKEKLTSVEERLRLAAVMLYWAEGFKVGKQQTVDFANSDPYMILIFTNFLRNICQIDEKRLRACIYCYEGQDVDALTKFWSNVLSIPASQFTKPYIKRAAMPGPRGPRMIHGLVHVRYCDKKLLRQILEWIEKYCHESVGGGVVNRTTL